MDANEGNLLTTIALSKMVKSESDTHSFVPFHEPYPRLNLQKTPLKHSSYGKVQHLNGFPEAY